MKTVRTHDSRRRRIVSLLSLLAVAGTFVCTSCGKKTADTGTETTGTQTTAAVTTGAPETEFVSDSLPSLNYDGKTVTIHAREDSVDEIFSEHAEGGLVHQLIYDRNARVEDRLGIKIKVYECEGWQRYDAAITNLTASISAGDQAYDLIAGWSARIPSLSTLGMLLDLTDIGYLDPGKPWWNKSCQEELRLGSNMFFVAGDISLSFLDTMSVYTFNQQLAQDYKTENLYQVVNERRWTIDYVDRLTRNIYKDLNGDTKVDPGDLFGLTTSSENDADGYLQGFHASMSTRDEDGYPQFDPDVIFLGSIVEKVYDLTWGNPGCLTNAGGTTDYDCFAENRALLSVCRVGDVTTRYVNMTADYGILPYPLYDETQQEYGTRLQDGVSLWCIPIDVRDIEMSTAVLEALGSQSYRDVTPQYFDNILKNRYSRDEETKEMMDLIKNSVWITFDSLYNESIGYPWHYLRYMMMGQNRNFTSFWAMCVDTYDAKYEEVIAKMKALDA